MRFPKLFKEGSTSEKMQFRAILFFSRLMKGINKKKVVFMCFNGRSYGDNPKCISERLHERCPEAEIVWAFRGSSFHEMKKQVPDYVRCISTKARSHLVDMATARVWVDNFTKNPILKNFPKGKQFYIQTWHGDRAIKKICYDGFAEPEWRLEEQCDLVLTGSEFGQKMYRTAFRYKGPYMNEGAPRNDILVRNDPEEAARIREKLGIEPGVKLLLYAPTYRENSDTVPQDAQMDLNRTMDLLEENGEKWICLYRAHYISDGIETNARKDRVMDVTKYGDMSELLLISDMLLTDYSSCAMDYCLLDRPAFMYMADFDEYLASRAVYYDPHDTPMLIAHNQDELEKLIRNTDAEAAKQNCRAIREYYGMHETGRATDAVCDYIIDKLK